MDERYLSLLGTCRARSAETPTLAERARDPAPFAAFLSNCILSASGWRAVFAESGDEEDAGHRPSPSGLAVAAAMAAVFAEHLPGLCGKPAGTACVALACDTRPTGDLLVDAMLRVFLAKGVAVRLLYIAAAPEAMAYARQCPAVDAFAYVSASHNPIGHNGVKFGLKTGGVLSGPQLAPLIADLKAFPGRPGGLDGLIAALVRPDPAIAACHAGAPAIKEDALAAYAAFSDLVVGDRVELAAAVAADPIGVLADLNGSARTVSIDRSYLTGIGVDFAAVNDRPREIAHRIVPEGRSLDQCRTALAEAHARDPRFRLGYVPDNDGDRGNVVCVDGSRSGARILEAQEVFALCVLSELACLDAAGVDMAGVAVAVNDPTSQRVDRIAARFGAAVRRAEVGEANVVNLAAELRGQGWTVRILGEGSNGGNITHPAAVRDPLNTVASIVKLLRLKGGAGRPGPFEAWCRRIGRPYSPDFELTDVVASLPAFTTTSAYEDRALLKIRSLDHAALKAAYERHYAADWEARRSELARRFGVAGWREINYEGTREIIGFGPACRSGAQRGGLKIQFEDAAGQFVACLWMRGSGTEPVFRVAVDLRGDDAAGEAWLLEWQVDLIRRADAEACR